MMLPLDQAGAQHSQSPMDAEIGTVMEFIRFPSCPGVDRKMELRTLPVKYGQNHSPILNRAEIRAFLGDPAGIRFSCWAKSITCGLSRL